MDSDDSHDFTLPETETVEYCTETSGLSQEQETLLQEHINYHDKMKKFLERCLHKEQTEGPLAVSVYFKSKKPKNLRQALQTCLKKTVRGKLKVCKKRTRSQNPSSWIKHCQFYRNFRRYPNFLSSRTKIYEL